MKKPNWRTKREHQQEKTEKFNKTSKMIPETELATKYNNIKKEASFENQNIATVKHGDLEQQLQSNISNCENFTPLAGLKMFSALVNLLRTNQIAALETTDQSVHGIESKLHTNHRKLFQDNKTNDGGKKYSKNWIKKRFSKNW